MSPRAMRLHVALNGQQYTPGHNFTYESVDLPTLLRTEPTSAAYLPCTTTTTTTSHRCPLSTFTAPFLPGRYVPRAAGSSVTVVGDAFISAADPSQVGKSLNPNPNPEPQP